MSPVRLTRRAMIGTGSAAALGLWIPQSLRREAFSSSLRRFELAGSGVFDAVMSGDPTPDAVTLWTRVGETGQHRLSVGLEVARDPGFSRVVVRADVPTSATRDRTVKVRIAGLAPDTRYWFRFRTRCASSEVGRTQTAPPPDSQRPVRIGYFACQAYTAGYYGAYRRLLALDPDVVVCGGDYIYERTFSEDGYARVDARRDSTGANGDGEARTLADYRAKYRLYRSDADLRELHRLVPLVAQWDDHEVADDYAGGAAARAGGGERARMIAGRRAWHEHMPSACAPRRVHRGLRFGRSVELLMLDSRSYRADQPSWTEARDAPRAFLGREQLDWVKHRLATSDATWKLIGNQVMVMPLSVGDRPPSRDSWDGYRAERAELLRAVAGVDDVVFLTGDRHVFLAGDVLLHGDRGPRVATEIVGGSVTSPGLGDGLPVARAERLVADGLRARNPWLRLADVRRHGFAVVEASSDALTAELWGSGDVTTHAASAAVEPFARYELGAARAGQ